MSPARRDEEGRWTAAPSWESLVDRQIREAMEEGLFDDLPYHGQPLPLEDDAAAGDRALAFRVLKNAGGAPDWIEADKEARELLARRDAVLARAPRSSPLGRRRDRAELGAIVEAHRLAVLRLNAAAPTDRQHRRPLELATEMARLERAHRGDEP